MQLCHTIIDFGKIYMYIWTEVYFKLFTDKKQFWASSIRLWEPFEGTHVPVLFWNQKQQTENKNHPDRLRSAC